MFFCLKYRSDAGNVMIVHKSIKMLSAVQAPVFAAELPVYGMGDLKHIHIVKAGEQALIALIICHAVQHLIVHPLIVVAVQRFA